MASVSGQRSAHLRIPSPSLPTIAYRLSSRRTPPPPPPISRARRPRQIRIPVTQFIVYESTEKENPFSDAYHLPPSPSPSPRSLPFAKSNANDFDPTASIRRTYRASPAVMQPASSARIQELQNIPCTEERCKLVAGKILNRGGKSVRCPRRPPPSNCGAGYVRSSLSNVVVVAGDD